MVKGKKSERFSAADRRTIAKRADNKCSFPGCTKTMSGPKGTADSVCIGVAAHICAASQGGPRFDRDQDPSERNSPENGIWLCRDHHDLVDQDEIKYSAAVLRVYKAKAEERADSANLPSKSEPIAWMRLDHRQNPEFVGRDQDLDKLFTLLKDRRRSAISPCVVCTGLVGIGKTQLVVEFAYRYLHYYPGGIFWIKCGQPEQVSDELIACGLAMGLFPNIDSLHPEDKTRLVKEEWRKDIRQRLIIFDNCEEERILHNFLPKDQHNHVLITSRRQEWSKSLGIQFYSLDVLDRNHSVSMLQARRPELTPLESNDIAAELGDLPLALYLAACYLESYRSTTPATYLKDLRNSLLRHESLEGRGADDYKPTGHNTHIRISFAVSLDCLDKNIYTDHIALSILLHASYFAPGENIDSTHLMKTVVNTHTRLEIIEDALKRLTSLGLLRRSGENQLSIHRLLSHYCKSIHTDNQCREAEDAVIDLVLKLAYRASDSKRFIQISPIIPHLRYLVDAYSSETSERSFRLAKGIGICLFLLGMYKEAERHLRSSLTCSDQLYGIESPQSASIIGELAVVHQNLNRRDEAERLFRQALAIEEKSASPDPTTLSRALNNLAQMLGPDHPESESMLRKALFLELEHNPGHHKVAIRLGNLARLLQEKGHEDQAEDLFKQALDIDEKNLGHDDVDVARDLIGLGGLYVHTKRYSEAEPLLIRAIDIIKSGSGPDHPNLIRVIKHLASLYEKTDRSDKAHFELQHALAISLKVYGPEHTGTSTLQDRLKRYQSL